MDTTRSSQSSVPANNMTNALIFQAVIAGMMAILAFLFRGKMARSEAAAWEQQTLEKLSALSDKVKVNSHLTTSLYPLSSVLGITLTDPPTIADDNEQGIIIKKERRRINSVLKTEN